jgi:MFS family permease
MNQAAANNVKHLLVIRAGQWFLILMPFIYPYFQSRGLSPGEILSLQSIYSITCALMEVPSGYFSDKLGRRKTMILGCLFYLIAYLFFSFGYGYWQIGIGELFWGIGVSFLSGTDSALLFESLRVNNDLGKYKKIEGKAVSIGNVSEASAGIIGGIFAGFMIELPMYIQCLTTLMVLIYAFKLRDTQEASQRRTSFKHDFKKLVFHKLKRNPILFWTLISSSIFGLTTLSYAWMAQPLFLHHEIPIKWFGILWTILNLTVALGSRFAHLLDEIMQSHVIFAIILLTFVFCTYSTGLTDNLWGVGLILFLVYLFRGIGTPLYRAYILEFTDDYDRATLLSIRNLIIRLFFGISSFFLGFVCDWYSIKTAFQLLCIPVLIGLLIEIILYFKTKKSSH